jgi:hypothetical protein
MRKSFTAVALVVGMALGSLLTMAFNPVGAASALVGATSSAKGSHQNVVQQALSTLVGNGTITQKQSDAITTQINGDQQARWAKRPPLGRSQLPQLAALLGIDVQTLRADLKSGQTLAQVATAKGISPTTLANELVSVLDKGIAARVAGHRLNPAAANAMTTNLPARINALLNRTWGRGVAFVPKAKPNATPGVPTTAPPASAGSTPTTPTTPTPPTTSAGSGTPTTGGSTTSTAATPTTQSH